VTENACLDEGIIDNESVGKVREPAGNLSFF
jgi:hypothetical protein